MKSLLPFQNTLLSLTYEKSKLGVAMDTHLSTEEQGSRMFGARSRTKIQTRKKKDRRPYFQKPHLDSSFLIYHCSRRPAKSSFEKYLVYKEFYFWSVHLQVALWVDTQSNISINILPSSNINDKVLLVNLLGGGKKKEKKNLSDSSTETLFCNMMIQVMYCEQSPARFGNWLPGL